jgi:hypothetical protein
VKVLTVTNWSAAAARCSASNTAINPASGKWNAVADVHDGELAPCEHKWNVPWSAPPQFAFAVIRSVMEPKSPSASWGLSLTSQTNDAWASAAHDAAMNENPATNNLGSFAI